jgi:hypothetical protein
MILVCDALMSEKTLHVYSHLVNRFVLEPPPDLTSAPDFVAFQMAVLTFLESLATAFTNPLLQVTIAQKSFFF